jgi:hypothetical protein
LLYLVGLAVVVALGVLVWLHFPRTPPPTAWNRLAATLLADEFHGDTQWNPVLMANASPPRTPDRVLAELRASVDSLDGRWFRGGWHGLTPGQLPPLESAADAYAQLYRYANTSPRITAAFDGRSLPVAVTASPAEPNWLLGQLARLRSHLAAAAAPWTGPKPAPAGSDADRLRALLAAHAELAAAETALLQFAADHPDTPLIVAGPDGATPLTSRGKTLSPEAQRLLSNRAQAVSDLRQAEANAQK